MQGPKKNEGVIPLTIRTAFEIMQKSSQDAIFQVKISMVEVYMEKVRDLIDIGRVNL